MEEIEFQEVGIDGDLSLTEMDAGQIITHLVAHSIKREASDLFFSTCLNYCEVSIRRMGSIESLVRVPKAIGQQMINTIKSNAGMDLGEKRRPMDGRWTHQSETLSVDFRVNSLGTFHGEDVSLRVLRSSERLQTLTGLGMLPQQVAVMRSMLSRPSGLILVTGPTGSGKTTTLYACLNHMNDGTRRISTLEDPVEHLVEGIRQSQVAPNFSLDFSDLLRGAMRQSPDVIMVGEIRDRETAATAVRAANSGHLVLSTLHAPLATSAVHSMLAFGVHPFFLSNALLGVVAQRLIRVLDPERRVEYPVPEETGMLDDIQELIDHNVNHSIYGPPTDATNPQDGYSGQTGLFEIMVVEKYLRDAISHNRPSAELRQLAIRQGMIDFRRSGLVHVANGVTSLEEMMREVPDDDHIDADKEPDSSGHVTGPHIPLASISELGKAPAPHSGQDGQRPRVSSR